VNPDAAILVVGGAGYIGSHTCEALARAGFTPVTYDSLDGGREAAVRWGPFERGDLGDRDRLDEVFDRFRPAAVVHFAGYISVGESVVDPGRYYRNNLSATLTLLEAMRDHGVAPMVFSSSAATYGVPREGSIDEDHPQDPINPYGFSKLVVERILGDFAAAHGFRGASMRYFNAAGADPEGRIGETHEPETHLIPLALAAAAGDRPELSLYGDDYDTPDGTCIRDYVHVCDLAEAHVLALRVLLAEGASPGARSFNLGSESGFSVREVIEVVERVTGRSVPVAVGPRREGDSPRLVCDSSRARRELGWKPRLSTIEAIVETAWNWYQKGL
jgi:UDP-arabinose 4-epimerase